MAALQIILTIVVVALLLLAISKKFQATTTLICLGVVTILIYSIVTKTPVGTSGSWFIDVFELIASNFSKQMSGSGLLIMSVMGFVKYMDHIKASKLLALYASRPLKKLGKPYLAAGLGIFIAAVLKLCIPSHSGLAALLMATMYPILVAAGLPTLTAAAAVLIGGCFDLGPACPITNWAVTQEPVAALTNIADFFVNYQVVRTLVVILVTTVVFVLLSKKADAKEGHAGEVSDDVVDPKSLGVPGFYAVLPVLPLVLVIVFSSLFNTGIKIGVPAANFLSFIVAFIIDLIFTKSKRVDSFNGTNEFWKGMGASFTSVVSLIGAAAVFSAAINYIGGTKAMMNSIANSSLGGVVIVIAAALINFLIAFITGSGVASSYAVLPMLYDPVAASGANLLLVVFAIVASGGMGRAISPVSGATIIVGGGSGHEVTDITKRTMIPVCTGFVAMIVMALIGM